MFKNQYLITNKKLNNELPFFRLKKFGSFDIHLGEKLKYVSHKEGDAEIAFIGILFDPINPDFTSNYILHQFFNNAPTLTGLLKGIEKFSGRFVVLFKNRDKYYVIGDFRHSRRIIYSTDSKNKFITSSLELYYLLSESCPDYNLEIKAFTEKEIFFEKQKDWPGFKTYDKNFKNLLPNHFLEIIESTVERIPIYSEPMSFEDVVENSYRILLGTYKYLSKHYNLIQPLTAGWDSRILLGASLNYQKLIKYYIFRREDNFTSTDIHLSQKIAKDLNLNFSVFDVENICTNFIDEFKKYNFHVNPISKLCDIQYHYIHHRNIEKLVNISGICGNLFRSEYGQTNKKVVNPFDIFCLSPYGPFNSLTRNEIKLWYDQTKDFAHYSGISLIDLYFIEIRMANWGSIYAYEQDIAIEEIDPFSNKSLMYPVLLLDKDHRGLSCKNLSGVLVKMFDETLLNYPCNPDKHLLRKYLSNNFELRSLSRKFKFLKSKYL